MGKIHKIALAVALSGIAATLLEGGRAAHSTFKLPMKICTSDVCRFWDEASVSHKASVEALDRAMRDLRNSNCPMGGSTILFSGDLSTTYLALDKYLKRSGSTIMMYVSYL